MGTTCRACTSNRTTTVTQVPLLDDSLRFSVGIAFADFALSNFYISPQCGCGLDCPDVDDVVTQSPIRLPGRHLVGPDEVTAGVGNGDDLERRGTDLELHEVLGVVIGQLSRVTFDTLVHELVSF
ncbi:hypothetical protein Cni_G06345 [Canna indica]|uniref:Uncharacterized protein n=1 Tax=Canna indica TaxID=4628 RepID=A0AAQ3JZ80_9LILI|nr:hypothetical protein Cni_G06345 [Canna indica]